MSELPNSGSAMISTNELLKRDMEYFDSEKSRMMQKILTITTQLDEARQEAEKYKRIWDRIKSGIRKGIEKKTPGSSMN